MEKCSFAVFIAVSSSSGPSAKADSGAKANAIMETRTAHEMIFFIKLTSPSFFPLDSFCLTKFHLSLIFHVQYPSGFPFCQRQESRHMSSRLFSAFHESSDIALEGSAKHSATSPLLRPAMS